MEKRLQIVLIMRWFILSVFPAIERKIIASPFCSLSARQKMSSLFNQETENRIKENSLMENEINVYGYFEFAKTKGHFYVEWLYYLNHEEFLRKMNLRYPTATEAEIKNIVRIYLQPVSDEQSNDKGEGGGKGEGLHGLRISRTFLQEDISKLRWIIIIRGWMRIMKPIYIFRNIHFDDYSLNIYKIK